MKIRLTFQELVSYETTIDFDPTPEQAEEIGERVAGDEALDVVIEDVLSVAGESGEPLWFDLLEEQNKDWATMRVAGVDERHLTDVRIED